MKIPYLYDPSQQILRLNGEELIRDMEGAHFLFVNDYEFDLICKKTNLDLPHLLKHVDVLVITRGADGSSVYSGDEEHHIPVVIPDLIVDPTGVGDAYRGGFLTGYAHHWSSELCGQVGALAATYCLEHKGPQSHTYSREEFMERFRENFNDKSVLDALLK